MDHDEHMSEVWHRIEDRRYAPPVDEFGRPSGVGSVNVVHLTYPVAKTTPKGVWLTVSFSRRFVRLDSKRQFASPTFEQAKDKFCLRKRRQLSILRAQVKDIETALHKLEDLKPRS